MKNSISAKINLNLWVARDKYCKLYIYKHKPIKHIELGFWTVYDDRSLHFESKYIDIESSAILFPNIEDYFDFSLVLWEDDEPKQLKDILKGEY